MNNKMTVYRLAIGDKSSAVVISDAESAKMQQAELLKYGFKAEIEEVTFTLPADLHWTRAKASTEHIGKRFKEAAQEILIDTDKYIDVCIVNNDTYFVDLYNEKMQLISSRQYKVADIEAIDIQKTMQLWLKPLIVEDTLLKLQNILDDLILSNEKFFTAHALHNGKYRVILAASNGKHLSWEDFSRQQIEDRDQVIDILVNMGGKYSAR